MIKGINKKEYSKIKDKISSHNKNQNLHTIYEQQKYASVIVRRRVSGENRKPLYILEKGLNITLSNGDIIKINKGFVWDLSSVPRFLWWLLPPDGDFEIASLIHDFLYINRNKFNYSRKFVDKEMLIWSKAANGTSSKFSIRNIDNYIRYYAVRAFGWIVWNKNK